MWAGRLTLVFFFDFFELLNILPAKFIAIGLG
jgi:hypothetical protein